ncbi:Serine/threonine phosphatase stp [Rosistilla carotiformis]|uniref:Serine/threonine phosphatase stp n=1 Tax=Rosistilla carotiformis TaxID=2528017 RepID=A0A518JUC6_9BACT|nr:Serine/threonine phosphatase stp [Rosistilla carotiformis]
MLNPCGPGPSIIYRDRRMNRAAVHLAAGGEAAVFTSRSPNKETPNEDVAAIVPCDGDTCVLIVADGMGGHSAGEVASLMAVREMVLAINEALRQQFMLRIGIINGFERANEAVQAMGIGSGTTLAVVEITKDEVRPYHAGDSVVLVVGSRGKIKLETTSHSPVGFGLAAGFLNSKEAMEHAERHVILNAVGSASMRIEIGSAIRLAARDTVLLASDGLTDNVTIQEAIDRIRSGKIEESVNELTSLAVQRMGSPGEGRPSKPDDLTVLLFRRQSG